jgi:hypothetical protein
MNLGAKPPKTWDVKAWVDAFKSGHTQARHAAAELALKADALAEKTSTLIAHLERMNCLTREEDPLVEEVRAALNGLVSG